MEKYLSMTYLTKREVRGLNYKFKKIKAIQNNKCVRCGFFTTNFCSNCEEFGRIKLNDYLYTLDYNIKNSDYVKVKKDLVFTELQKKCSTFMIKCLNEKKSMLVWAVCGAGKTEITFPVIEEVLIKGGNVCFAIPRIDILYEVYERLSDFFPNVLIKVLNSKEEKLVDAQIYVMTTNQILKFKNCFSLCIVDEVDAFPYEHNPKFDYGMNSSLNNGGVIFYLTSTPSDELKSKKFETFIINRRWHGFDLPKPKTKYLEINLFKYNLIPFSLIWKLYFEKKQQLWFVSNIKLGLKIKDVVSMYTNQVEFVYSADEDRRKKILDFKNNKFKILITTTILERGVTFDDINCYVLDADSPLYNKASLVQIAGRVNRKIDYQDGRVIFFNKGVTNVMSNAIKEIEFMNSKP